MLCKSCSPVGVTLLLLRESNKYRNCTLFKKQSLHSQLCSMPRLFLILTSRDAEKHQVVDNCSISCFENGIINNSVNISLCWHDSPLRHKWQKGGQGEMTKGAVFMLDQTDWPSSVFQLLYEFDTSWSSCCSNIGKIWGLWKTLKVFVLKFKAVERN